MTIAIGTIRAEPHAEVGAILMREAGAIIERWCDRARAEQPGAARLHHDVLKNELRDFLHAMGSGIRQAGQHNPREHRDNAIGHGEQRWDHGWSITELVRDYQILHTLLLEYLTHELRRTLTQRETMSIAVFIHDAIAASIAAYVANRDHELRAMERGNSESLQEAYRRKDAFLAVVVHELRNPVSPIATSAHALSLMLPDADERVRDAINVIRRQSHHLSRLLDDLTDLTRLNQGRLHLDRKVVDMAAVTEHAVEACRAFIESRGHRLSVRIPARPLLVDCDPMRIAQVLMNLLNNASKYTPPGGAIFVDAERSGPIVEIRVRDTGIGIPPSAITQVFDLYTRLTPANEHSPDGLGIGLALVKNLVALHDGTVDCHSDGDGAGTEFVVRLPAYQGQNPVQYPTPRIMDARRIPLTRPPGDGPDEVTELQ